MENSVNIEKNHRGESDVYDVLNAYDIRCPATADAVKEIFKGNLQDAAVALKRAQDLDRPPLHEMEELSRFYEIMRSRMMFSSKTGWDDEVAFPTENLIEAFFKNLRGSGTITDLADAANFLMMIAYRGRGSQLAQKLDEVHYQPTMKPGHVYIVDEDGTVTEASQGVNVEIAPEAWTTAYELRDSV